MVNLDNLFLRIKELGISAKKVSDDTGISNGNISDWKNGRSMPTAIKLDVLANYLDCSVDYLLGRTNEYTKIKGSTIVAENIKDTNIESDMIEDTSIMGINIENTKIGSSYRKNNTEQSINENEAELLNVYRSLSFRDKHELMSILYKMQDKTIEPENC